MNAPATTRVPAGWYRSGARRRTVTMGDARRMSNSAWANSSRLITGLLMYTGLGWLVSRWVGHQALLMTIGAFVGLALSYYLIFKSLAHEAREDERRQESMKDSTRAGKKSERGMEEPGVI
jgi:F0F1-type ATP synthase assembly protein I